jgi:long-chain acyl-CoA synthetase
MAALFEMASKKYPQHRCLGTRKLIKSEFIEAADGRKFEKLHLGEYQWNSYSEAFTRASNFASGLIKMGHQVDSHALSSLIQELSGSLLLRDAFDKI